MERGPGPGHGEQRVSPRWVGRLSPGGCRASINLRVLMGPAGTLIPQQDTAPQRALKAPFSQGVGVAEPVLADVEITLCVFSCRLPLTVFQ